MVGSYSPSISRTRENVFELWELSRSLASHVDNSEAQRHTLLGKYIGPSDVLTAKLCLAQQGVRDLGEKRSGLEKIICCLEKTSTSTLGKLPLFSAPDLEKNVFLLRTFLKLLPFN